MEEDEYDYEVISASDGFEAGLQVNHFKPDLLILDIMMPDIKGYEVCKKIKNHRRNRPHQNHRSVRLSGRRKISNR